MAEGIVEVAEPLMKRFAQNTLVLQACLASTRRLCHQPVLASRLEDTAQWRRGPVAMLRGPIRKRKHDATLIDRVSVIHSGPSWYLVTCVNDTQQGHLQATTVF